MSLPVVLRPGAEADIKEAYAWHEEIHIGLGERFSESVREVLERIELMPETHGMVWRDVRAVRMRKFRYIVYYIVRRDRVEVLGVIHGARNESEWRSRIWVFATMRAAGSTPLPPVLPRPRVFGIPSL